MGFYEEISRYYDHIFPTEKAQCDFIKNAAGEPPKSILDIACGSGGYIVELARAGYSVAAVDLDGKMIEMALAKKNMEGLDFDAMVLNMLDIADRFGKDSFDLAFCIGNSIVHLGSREEILKALKKIAYVLKPGGSMIIQIINFDRVFRHSITSLPTISDDHAGLKFVRNYSYDENKGLIRFNTLLTVDGLDGREEYENSIELLPLLSGDMRELLQKAGFKDISFYGDFKYSEYDTESYMLVVKAFA